MSIFSSVLRWSFARSDAARVYRRYGNAQNQLGQVFHCDIKCQAARQCGDEECEFFMNFLSQ